MKSNAPATNRRQQQGNVRSLLTPEMRQHIRDLKRGLVQCGWPLLEHLGSLDTMVGALGTAERAADCLLADDPFEAWAKQSEQNKWDELGDATKKQQAKTTAAPNVTRMIARPMRQQLVEAIKRVDEYHRCLAELVEDLSKLESFDTAERLAEGLQRDRPLETAAARKKRKEAEADDDLDGL